jgi:CsoR family transcriptional regulator, copper-sensing transcriptional repressor
MKHPTAQAVVAQKSVLDRVKRIEGQLRGIHKMIENETYCDDIINQIEAVRSALASVEIVLLESHIRNCVVDQIKDGDSEVVDEVLKTVKKMMK